MKSMIIALLGLSTSAIALAASPGAGSDRFPSEWSASKKQAIRSSYKGKVTAAFVKEANKPESVVQKDIARVLAEFEKEFSGCGGVTIAKKVTAASVFVTPYSFEGFYGRHCVEEPKENCDTQDDETFLVMLPFTSSCTRTSSGSSLIYKMTYQENFRGGKPTVVGPVPVKVSE